jgi:NADPH-dependent curcumin reductase CurA
VRTVDPTLAPLPMHLGVLGITGLTAYFGLLDIGRPHPGNTVVVSAAAGAVGSIAGQIARIKGCRTVGIAGGADKCQTLIEEFGFDVAIDYKAGDLKKTLREACPKGLDIYFDNVGGKILEAALSQMARGARIVLSGAISQYNSTTPVKGPSNYMSLLVQRASMTGMVVFDYADRYDEAIRELSGWLAAGQLHSRDQVIDGLPNFPDGLPMLFRGDNTGKLVLKV